MAFTKEKVNQTKEEKFMSKIKPNDKKNEQLDYYIAFAPKGINKIDAENIPYINEQLENINFKRQVEEDLPPIELIDMSEYHKKINEKNNNKSNGKKSGSKPQSSKSSDDKPNMEPIYADYILNDDNNTVEQLGENLIMYKWNGIFHDGISDVVGEGHAMKWLRSTDKNEATDYRSKSCYKTATKTLLSEDRIVPVDTTEIIIPMANAWFKVFDNGSIYTMEPNKEIGIKFQIKGKIDLNNNVNIVDDFGNQIVEEKKVATSDYGDLLNQYIPKAVPKDSLWGKFLDLSVPNKEDQRLLAQFFGSTLIPDNRYQRALVLEGPGSNGKSVVAEVCGAMHKKTATINLDDLTGFSKHELLTASMVIVPETPKRNINEQELKKIISGDKIVIAQKHKDQFSHNPKAKILIACNSFPKIEDESNGLWRRLMLMKFNQVIDKGQEVRNLEKLIIEKEMNIVIDWALAGLQDLLKSGDFVIPSHIEENKELEKKNSKNPLEFLDDMYVEMSDEFTLAKDTLYNKYKIYCQDKGLSIFGEVQFWKIVKQKFPKFEVIQKRESAGRKRYCNLFFDFSQADEDPAIEELTNKMSLEQELEMIERSFASKTISINEYANGIKRAYEKHSKLPQYS